MISWYSKKEVNKWGPLRGSITAYREENSVSHHFDVEMFLYFSLKLLRNTYFADTEDHTEAICIMKNFTKRSLK